YYFTQRQHIITPLDSCLNISILLTGICCVKESEIAVFICLIGFYMFLVGLHCVKFTLRVLKQCKVLRLFIEFLFTDHSILYKQSNAIPLLFVSFPILL